MDYEDLRNDGFDLYENLMKDSKNEDGKNSERGDSLIQFFYEEYYDFQKFPK